MCEWWQVQELTDTSLDPVFGPGGYVNSANVDALAVTKLHETSNSRDVYYIATGIGNLFLSTSGFLTSTAAYEEAQRWCGGRNA
jgi:hypothetical protein